jgi:hypothetical protein
MASNEPNEEIGCAQSGRPGANRNPTKDYLEHSNFLLHFDLHPRFLPGVQTRFGLVPQILASHYTLIIKEAGAKRAY